MQHYSAAARAISILYASTPIIRSVSSSYAVYQYALLARLLSLVLVFGVLWPLLTNVSKLARRLVQRIVRGARPQPGQI
jgi:hypothetical protein